MTLPPQALLFDLGGVLIDIDFSRAIRAWAPFSALTESQLAAAFRFDAAYAQHECGRLSSPAYFAHLADVLQLSATPAQVEAGWNAIFKGEIAATRRLVQQAGRMLPCHAFTNTNHSHMQVWTALYPDVVAAFRHIFASHQIGLRKPDRAAFDLVCTAMQCKPAEVLFFDDLADNVQAAQAAGLQAVLVRSPRDVESALQAVGVV
jgi:putative hydrolase of the HAD superfamily